jgi:hypothetical protein
MAALDTVVSASDAEISDRAAPQIAVGFKEGQIVNTGDF